MGYVEDLRAVVGHRPLILVGVVVFIFNPNGELLLQRKTSGRWAVPGGLMELGESTEETGRREVLEETGLRVGTMKLVGVASGQDQFVKLKNGDELYAVTIAYSTHDIVGGNLQADGVESIELRYYPLHLLPDDLNPKIKTMILRHIE
ncbi:NUDIX hydrolase [Paenibacillus sp. MSJ-34]|uniref:NUDIX hydrolase n=1 Tax=Paenibacillus sp. MSJ-34 TaxID=2841529 RepID=UPI001C11869B|nr:NUDIX hydrolase [Paenibacillus sp. MSJ-34]MBU5442402.1 NUDIX hydrolase [Paenibacillus sp. MSJ-34]